MSKLLKYRVWDKNRKKLTYPEQGEYKPTEDHPNLAAGYYLMNQMGILLCNDGIVLDDWHDSFILTEFIGLKDKAGKDIYDGDIVKWYGMKKPLQVKWDDEKACYILTKDGMKYPQYFGLIDLLEIKVVGNIFQNSNLLK